MMTKLYDLKRGDRFKVIDGKYPPGAPPANDQILKLHNIDGMYSYCTDDKGDIYHPVAWAEVEKVDND